MSPPFEIIDILTKCITVSMNLSKKIYWCWIRCLSIAFVTNFTNRCHIFTHILAGNTCKAECLRYAGTLVDRILVARSDDVISNGGGNGCFLGNTDPLSFTRTPLARGGWQVTTTGHCGGKKIRALFLQAPSVDFFDFKRNFDLRFCFLFWRLL